MCWGFNLRSWVLALLKSLGVISRTRESHVRTGVRRSLACWFLWWRTMPSERLTVFSHGFRPSFRRTTKLRFSLLMTASRGRTFEVGHQVKTADSLSFPLRVPFNPINQGYGGNQKIGYHCAIAEIRNARFDGRSGNLGVRFDSANCTTEDEMKIISEKNSVRNTCLWDIGAPGRNPRLWNGSKRLARWWCYCTIS
jgi:hypothetical protein